MGIFSSSKKAEAPKAEKAVKAVAPKKASASAPVMTSHSLQALVSRARITEKSALASEKGTYVFDVSLDATKKGVALAIESLYKVKPVGVNIVNVPRKQVFIRGKRGMKSATKKAYVFLKKGDKIEIV